MKASDFAAAQPAKAFATARRSAKSMAPSRYAAS
jgi:hypothetical protein